jgi:hypothetical protein
MIDARGTVRLAHTMIEDYCDGAANEAGRRAEASAVRGDLDGQLVWLEVLSIITRLRS